MGNRGEGGPRVERLLTDQKDEEQNVSWPISLDNTDTVRNIIDSLLLLQGDLMSKESRLTTQTLLPEAKSEL